MGFSGSGREDAHSWRHTQANLDSSNEPLSESSAIGERLPEGGQSDQEGDDEYGRPRRLASPRKVVQAFDHSDMDQEEADLEDQESYEANLDPEQLARLTALKRAANRVRRLEKAAIDLTKTYRVGQRLFDPEAQRFGRVIFAAEGYFRLELSDGSSSAHGKPPLDDRKAFVCANFERMDNKQMADILEISVHTMRRLCHEYGLRRHAKKVANAG